MPFNSSGEGQTWTNSKGSGEMAQRGQAWSIAVCVPYLSVKNSQNKLI